MHFREHRIKYSLVYQCHMEFPLCWTNKGFSILFCSILFITKKHVVHFVDCLRLLGSQCLSCKPAELKAPALPFVSHPIFQQPTWTCRICHAPVLFKRKSSSAFDPFSEAFAVVWAWVIHTDKLLLYLLVLVSASVLGLCLSHLLLIIDEQSLPF